MRTTVDLDESLLATLKSRAASSRTTLSRLVEDAVRAYLGSGVSRTADAPFKLVTAGRPGGRYPTAAEVSALLAEDD